MTTSTLNAPARTGAPTRNDPQTWIASHTALVLKALINDDLCESDPEAPPKVQNAKGWLFVEIRNVAKRGYTELCETLCETTDEDELIEDIGFALGSLRTIALLANLIVMGACSDPDLADEAENITALDEIIRAFASRYAFTEA